MHDYSIVSFVFGFNKYNNFYFLRGNNQHQSPDFQVETLDGVEDDESVESFTSTRSRGGWAGIIISRRLGSTPSAGISPRRLPPAEKRRLPPAQRLPPAGKFRPIFAVPVESSLA